jgi:omega-6 fatty acid desaturase (delta-12 desaturase)
LIATYVKLFLIAHDANHESYFPGRRANRFAAIFAGMIANTSRSVWRREHSRHHRNSNNLDQLQDGQTSPLTLQEFRQLPAWGRWLYAIGTFPPLLYSLGATGYFLVFMRVRARWQENLLQFFWFAILFHFRVLALYLITFSIAAALGFLVFHAQHTFHDVYKRRSDRYDAFENGMYGASLLLLPKLGPLDGIVRFVLHGIEHHHLHHLNPKIPGYRLRQCQMQSGALFDKCPRTSLKEALALTGCSLFDERSGHFVSPWKELAFRSRSQLSAAQLSAAQLSAAQLSAAQLSAAQLSAAQLSAARSHSPSTQGSQT